MPTRTRSYRLGAAALLLAVTVLAAACNPQPAPKTFTFAGGGWGHGVGMSQFGAQGMAAAGRSHTQILTTYYAGTRVQRAAVSNNLRVLVSAARPGYTLVAGGATTFGSAGTVPAGSKVTVTRSGANLRLAGAVNATVTSPLTVTYAPSTVNITELGNGYRFGHLVLRADGTGISAVVAGLTMQQYLYGLAEMPASWHAQALRAQVVAARTYAQKRRNARAGSGLHYDLLATVSDQVYAGTRTEDARWRSAVDVTAGEVITHNGALIDAVYSSSSGGHSETNTYVWGTAQAPYLQARPDPYDQIPANRYGTWERSYSAAQLGAWFGVGTVTGISIGRPLGASGRVDRATVTVTGTGGTKRMTGAQFRSKVNANNPDRATQLLSTNFVVK